MFTLPLTRGAGRDTMRQYDSHNGVDMQIDWNNARGMAAVTHHAGVRFAKIFPIRAQHVFNIMQSFGTRFTMDSMVHEMKPRGYGMITRAETELTVRAVIWFVNAADNVPLFIKPERIKKLSEFKPKIFATYKIMSMDLPTKQIEWQRAETHRLRSRHNKTQLYEYVEANSITDMLTNEPLQPKQLPEGQSVELDFAESVTIRDLPKDS